jgi:hypothetical protein
MRGTQRLGTSQQLPRVGAPSGIHSQGESMTITLTQDEIDALGEIFDLAHGDQESYINIGNPHIDYGDEWPFVAREKAKGFRLIARIGEKIELNGESERWEILANNMEASANEYE